MSGRLVGDVPVPTSNWWVVVWPKDRVVRRDGWRFWRKRVVWVERDEPLRQKLQNVVWENNALFADDVSFPPFEGWVDKAFLCHGERRVVEIGLYDDDVLMFPTEEMTIRWDVRGIFRITT